MISSSGPIAQTDPVDFDECVEKEYLRIIENAEKCMDKIDVFMEEISNNLSKFETENLQIFNDINSNHKEIESLIDQSLENIETFENKLNFYEKSLVNIRSNFNELEQFSTWEQNQQNKISLLKVLTDIMKVIELDHWDITKIFEVKDDSMFEKMDKISIQLTDIYQGNLPKGAICLPNIKERLDSNTTAIKTFCQKFSEFIVELIKQKFKSLTNYIPNSREDVHKTLITYSQILNRVKILDPFRYSEISDNYCKYLNEFYCKTWTVYIASFNEGIPHLDTSNYKKEGHSLMYRNEQEFLGKIQKITEFLKNSFALIDKISKDIYFYANKLFWLTNTEETETDKSKKRGLNPGELKLCKMVRSILDFLNKLFIDYFNELEKQDCLYIVSVYILIDNLRKQEIDNKYFVDFLIILQSECDERIKNIVVTFQSLCDSKKTRKGSQEMLKLFQDIITSISMMTPKNLEESGSVGILLKEILVFVLDSISNPILETEKISSDIYIIENLYNLQTCVVESKINVLSEERKKIKAKFSEEIQKHVKGSITSPFSKLIGLCEEIDKKIAASYSVAAIQSFVQSNKNEYKKYTKDFNFKNVKKIVEKTHKSVKKQFVDQSLFTSIWHQMSVEIISHIEKIHHMLATYCIKIPEMSVDFEMSELNKFVLGIDIQT